MSPLGYPRYPFRRSHVRRQIRRSARKRAGFIMAGSENRSATPSSTRGPTVSHICCAHGLNRLDHYAIYMENNSRYLEASGAGERSGSLHRINSYLTVDELATSCKTARRRCHYVGGEIRCRFAGAEGLSGRPPLPGGRRGPRRQDRRRLRKIGESVSGDADFRRMARDGDALFIRHDGAAERNPSPAAGESALELLPYSSSFPKLCATARR